MNSEDMIKQIADEWELPVEQVVLIWNIVCYMDENFDIYFDGSVAPIIIDFIKTKIK